MAIAYRVQLRDRKVTCSLNKTLNMESASRLCVKNLFGGIIWDYALKNGNRNCMESFYSLLLELEKVF